MVTELAKTGKPIVLVLAEGRPRVIHKIVPLVSAIVMAYLPGLEGSQAIADVLLGEVNPSGKLPFSYPSSPNGFTTYDYKVVESFGENHVSWEFPFGFGLSYTSFAYSDLRMSVLKLARTGKLAVSVAVKNTGIRAGKEVVELYISELYRSISPPNRELKGFRKVELQPGESRTISFTLTPDDLKFVGLDNKWVVEPGEFRISIAPLQQTFTLE